MSQAPVSPSLVDRFSYSVFYSTDDGGFVAPVAEFPSLSWVEKERREVEDGLLAVVEEVLAEMEHFGERVPGPHGERVFLGRFNLRWPTSLHREWALRAEREHQSLNTVVVSCYLAADKPRSTSTTTSVAGDRQ
ncbi:toxin-antitoxin system HicB family antitoxin [Nakamurella antarctica]|uniref:Toxin-antitoxin system HicB family antitoxin n=1 Tax=Nakamurella antarctica TaxID=1902245 RepID=A0A3G8ZJX4_9ACTN|nr:toxin-antitoxin system HicB family antitoxin [Nakamurella antarctica]AZI57510.1 toxin-antitoxin system HicB family antitoxin [Nakamurella antarctica]